MLNLFYHTSITYGRLTKILWTIICSAMFCAANNESTDRTNEEEKNHWTPIARQTEEYWHTYVFEYYQAMTERTELVAVIRRCNFASSSGIPHRIIHESCRIFTIFCLLQAHTVVLRRQNGWELSLCGRRCMSKQHHVTRRTHDG